MYNVLFSYEYDATVGDLKANELSVNRKSERHIKNIALFGVDSRDGEPTRSDCMIIMSVNSKTGTVKLISLMRDSKVEIENHGEQKICHAYSFGGAALAIKTINETFNLDITDYIQVDFHQMANLIGEIGGVNIDVSEKERKEANKYIREYYESYGATPILIEKAGYQHLNGVQAMTYARIRKGGTGDDWGRVERQNIVLNAMFEEIKGKSLKELVSMVPRLMQYITTSLSKTEIISILIKNIKNGVPDIEHIRIPEDGSWKYGGKSGQYIVYNLEKAAQNINDYIYN